MPQNQWRLFGDYGVQEYRCGLKQGQTLRVVKTIEIETFDRKPTGKRHEPGETWKVLSGSASDPGVVWLLEPNGDRHTWDDDQSIFEHFQIAPDESGQNLS